MNANARAESLIIRSLSSGVSVNLKCKVNPDLLCFAQVQHVVQRTLCYVFKDYHDVLSIRHDSHQKHNVRMPQNTLHHHLILNFLQQLFRQPWVKYFLDGHGSPVQEALVDG